MSALDLRRAAARVRRWRRGWAAAFLGVTTLFVSALAQGDGAGAAAFFGVMAVVIGVIADQRRRRLATKSEVESRARALLGPLDIPADPEELWSEQSFGGAVDFLASGDVSASDAVELTSDRDVLVVCAALAALAQRDDVPRDWTSAAIQRIRHAPYVEQYFLLHALAERAKAPVIGAALSQLDEGIDSNWIESLVARRLAAGEVVSVETLRRNVPWSLEPLVTAFVEYADPPVSDALAEPVAAWRKEIHRDGPQPALPAPAHRTELEGDRVESLRVTGRVSTQPVDDLRDLGPEREELAASMAERLGAPSPRSILLVGENGVGKTTLARAAAGRLGEPWILFEAGAAAVQAGAVYVGELETRVDELARMLADRAVVWLFPELENALYAGQHARSPRGLLDALLPHVESGSLIVVGETTPESYARLTTARPRLATVFDVEQVAPASQAATEAIAGGWLRSKWQLDASVHVLEEAYNLAHDFAPGAVAPGNVIRLLARAAEGATKSGSSTLEVGDVLGALSRSSGLPVALLDPGAPLDVDAVREFFEARIVGQPDAIDCMVDRIALIKAGLTDPARPLAVFLFVGPTGTGKTELAKATADFVFGTPERLVRIDMSEFQTPDSLERLLSDRLQSQRGASLLAAVRENPFSVVLLDEFEKAAPPIWDAFLQLFDDGRLTDTEGRTVDFRRCIVILTSNVGAAAAKPAPLGFGRSAEDFRADVVRDAVRRVFRPEFVNRLDEIVVFRPLDRNQMRSLLDKELADVLERRGLRSRPWAVIFDDSAIDFLIERGFNPDLGARPLKRAVETALLAPLARTIVREQVPEGDQFLFVAASRDGLSVRFVDPDEEPRSARGDTEPARRTELDVRAVALSPSGSSAEARFLLDELARIAAAVAGDTVRGRKEAGLVAMSRPGFWDDDGRGPVLSTIEHLDRLEAALRTAQRLGARLRRQLDESRGATSDLVELLAGRLYVLDRALLGIAEGIDDDVVLSIGPPEDEEFVQQLAEMYEAWAERRGMRCERRETPAGVELAIDGLGAGTILQDEAGLHVSERVESRGDGERSVRVSARVAVDGSTPPHRVVRRYRAGPAPLVRDTVRNYRTGRLDRVLAGDFDLF